MSAMQFSGSFHALFNLFHAMHGSQFSFSHASGVLTPQVYYVPRIFNLFHAMHFTVYCMPGSPWYGSSSHA